MNPKPPKWGTTDRWYHGPIAVGFGLGALGGAVWLLIDTFWGTDWGR